MSLAEKESDCSIPSKSAPSNLSFITCEQEVRFLMIAVGVLKEMSKSDCTSKEKVPVKAVP